MRATLHPSSPARQLAINYVALHGDLSGCWSVEAHRERALLAAAASRFDAHDRAQYCREALERIDPNALLGMPTWLATRALTPERFAVVNRRIDVLSHRGDPVDGSPGASTLGELASFAGLVTEPLVRSLTVADIAVYARVRTLLAYEQLDEAAFPDFDLVAHEVLAAAQNRNTGPAHGD